MKFLMFALAVLPSLLQAQVELTFSGSDTVTQGEPVVVTYRLRNVGTEPVGLQWGGGERGFFRIELQGPTGSKVLEPEDLHSFVVPLNTLPPMRTFGESLILSRWLNFEAAGQYHIKFSYTGAAYEGRGRKLEGVPVKLERVGSLSIRVLPRDPSALARRADDLLHRSTGVETNIYPARRAVEALGLIKDPLVVPYLLKVIEAKSYLADTAINGLVQVGGPSARKALEGLLNHPNAEVSRWAKAALMRVK
jgi:hypothetical protein